MGRMNDRLPAGPVRTGYGRRMRPSPGSHYNFSLPVEAWPRLKGGVREATFRSSASRRRLLRAGSATSAPLVVLLLLHGASPAVCGTFVSGHSHGLRLETGTYSRPTAPRCAWAGSAYQSDAQAALAVSFNCIGSYCARTLHRARPRPTRPTRPSACATATRTSSSPPRSADRNEFYGTIRPKRRIQPGERPCARLGQRGVEYVEVRLVDIDPFRPVGIGLEQMRLLDIFLLHCLLSTARPTRRRRSPP